MSLESLASVDTGQRIPPPKRRWSTRVLLPLGLLSVTSALLIGSTWKSLVPGRTVTVVPVMVKSVEATSGSASVVATGWLEPDPFAHYATALAPGVVKEVTVLEGQPVAKNDVVARLIDDDAKLALARAEADLGVAAAEYDLAKADLDAERETKDNLVNRTRALEVADANIAEVDAAFGQLDAEIDAENAQLAALSDEYERKQGLVESGAVSEGEVRRLSFAVDAQRAKLKATRMKRPMLDSRKEAAKADERAARRHTELLTDERHAVAVAESTLARASAAMNKAKAGRDEAQLRLDRMVVYAGFDGVVMRRLAWPGSRLITGGEEHSGHVVHIYDPAKLQVRVDVPLADAGAVGVGQLAEISIQVLPDHTFTGTVTRLVHRADIQKNTVEVKVALDNPAPVLKPDMLARVRFLAGGTTVESRQRVLVPESLITRQEGESSVWIVADRVDTQGVAERRAITVGRATVDGWIEVTDGLHPGDWLVSADHGDGAPRGLTEGERVTITGEARR